MLQENKLIVFTLELVFIMNTIPILNFSSLFILIHIENYIISFCAIVTIIQHDKHLEFNHIYKNKERILNYLPFINATNSKMMNVCFPKIKKHYIFSC